MEEFTKLINRLLDRAENAEADEFQMRTAVFERSAELKQIKAENDELKNTLTELRKQIEELEECL